MNDTILVAGATGNLGKRITKALIDRGAEVIAPVRASSEQSTINSLNELGAKVMQIDMNDLPQLVQACKGVDCIVSALAGLHDVIVGAQTLLLNAAVQAGVPRFIPSDFSSDFTDLPYAENRNFDLRKEFREKLLKSSIKHHSIFNGAFAEILGYGSPIYNKKNKSVAYYDNKQDWKIDFTTMDEAAAFTAAVALDAEAPAQLHIASFSVSPNDLVALSANIEPQPFTLTDMGSMEALSAKNKADRAQQPEGENNLYPSWQQSQYIYSMFFVAHQTLDNDRYKGLHWTTAEKFITSISKKNLNFR